MSRPTGFKPAQMTLGGEPEASPEPAKQRPIHPSEARLLSGQDTLRIMQGEPRSVVLAQRVRALQAQGYDVHVPDPEAPDPKKRTCVGCGLVVCEWYDSDEGPLCAICGL